jgi:hypothetical protein
MFTKSQVSKAQKSVMKEIPHFKGFELLRLKDFLELYSGEIGHSMKVKKKNKESPYEIICLVDRRADVKHTMSESRRRSLRRAGGAKRRRIKSKYHYENVTNRIHGFLLLEDQQKNKNIPRSKKVLSLSLICSSYYSNMKGVGSFLMKSMIALGKVAKYSDIILEVANDQVGSYEDEEEEEEEEWDSDEEEEESINQPLIDHLGREFMRKVVRVSEDGTAYYSIGDDYINDIIYSYLEDEYEYETYDEQFTEVDFSEPGENEYGGYWYSRGKRSQINLFQYYEKFGFKEEYKVHYEWKAFTTDPFPSMILNL